MIPVESGTIINSNYHWSLIVELLCEGVVPRYTFPAVYHPWSQNLIMAQKFPLFIRHLASIDLRLFICHVRLPGCGEWILRNTMFSARLILITSYRNMMEYDSKTMRMAMKYATALHIWVFLERGDFPKSTWWFQSISDDLGVAPF